MTAGGQPQKTSRGVRAGAAMGALLLFSASLAETLTEPAGSWGGRDPVPNFAAADGHLRLLYLAALIIPVVVGGFGGAILGRVTFALAERGASPRLLTVVLAIIGIVVGGALSKSNTPTVGTLGAFVFSMIVGATAGVVLASRVIRSFRFSRARAVKDPS